MRFNVLNRSEDLKDDSSPHEKLNKIELLGI